MLHLYSVWYPDAWLKYPSFDREEDFFFSKYMFLLCKQDKEQDHNRTVTNKNANNRNFLLQNDN